MSKLTLEEIDDDVFRALKAPSFRFYLVLIALLIIIIVGAIAFLFQQKIGIGVTGLNHPVMWGTYLGNYIFFIGLAQSGTFISAILFLVKARFRDEVSRAGEAMTVIMLTIGSMYPLIHLGRLWVFYYTLPYPSSRQIWPDFISAFLWDFFGIFTYLIVSIIFFYVGLLPDVASARDQFTITKGRNHPRTKLYRALALGWMGGASQWQHYNHSYLFFAIIATPLVISVHTVVAFDFSMALPAGWHVMLYGPYFVTGAIHSGIALVLTLLIPASKILQLNHIIQVRHFEKLAQVLLVTTCLMAYFYTMESFSDWYSSDIFENQFVIWRATGPYAPMFWTLLVCNILAPLTFISKKLRTNLKWLFAISILINVGMYLERYFLVIASTSHDFLPHTWGLYSMSLVEACITAGSFAIFFFFYLILIKIFPIIPMSDLKSQLVEDKVEKYHLQPSSHKTTIPDPGMNTIIGVYKTAYDLFNAVKAFTDANVKPIESFSPMKMSPLEMILGRPSSPVRFWTLGGAFLGIISGYIFPIYAATVNNLIAGGKHAVSWIPYTVISFEMMLLLGALGNLTGLIVHARLYKLKLLPYYDNRFSRHLFGVAVGCSESDMESTRSLVERTNPVEIITNGK